MRECILGAARRRQDDGGNDIPHGRRCAQPVAPFSHAVEVDGWVLVTGQMPNDPTDEAAPLPPTVEE